MVLITEFTPKTLNNIKQYLCDMTNEEKILELFENYFSNASTLELNEDVAQINVLGNEGVTFEEYVEHLNNVTSSDNLKQHN